MGKAFIGKGGDGGAARTKTFLSIDFQYVRLSVLTSDMSIYLSLHPSARPAFCQYIRPSFLPSLSSFVRPVRVFKDHQK